MSAPGTADLTLEPLAPDWWHIRDNERPHDLEALEHGKDIVV
jgi:hypothetical protein